jgi:hypothetical protein
MKPPPSGRGRYEALSDEGEPFVADDAAVTCGAAHAALVALEVLKNAVSQPAWLLIGFRTEWLFAREGRMISLDVGGPPTVVASTDNTEAEEFAMALAKEVLSAGAGTS